MRYQITSIYHNQYKHTIIVSNSKEAMEQIDYLISDYGFDRKKKTTIHMFYTIMNRPTLAPECIRWLLNSGNLCITRTKELPTVLSFEDITMLEKQDE